MSLVRIAVLVASVVGLTTSHLPAANAQLPPAKKESELVAAGHKPLTGAQLSAKLTGNTSYVVFLASTGGAATGSTVTIFYRNAKTRVSVPSGGPMAGKKIESNWWIEGNFLCTEQRIINQGHACTSQYEVGSSTYSCIQPAGNCVYFSRTVPGNPDNL